ncbi:YTH domain-containing protein ECT4-like [Zingiber officinale]|uniref:YTH domain-containing protein ECT4-like n=1 Tax=Zingiber officinale TaxID=94328 RepID=UPI001C4BFCC9|nr:YTH domain-containing protein ECT4-like [Zingiber officinale]
MAAVAPAAAPADQTTDLMEKLSLDTTSKSNEARETTKKPSGIHYGPVNGGEAPIAPVPSNKQTWTPLLEENADASTFYLPNGYTSPFYYGGYDGSVTEWEEYPRYVSPEGGVYGDMYGYGYASYGPYPSPGSPAPNLGQSSHLYGVQHYQYPTSYYQPPITFSPFMTSQSPNAKGAVPTSSAVDVPSIPGDAAKPIFNGTAKENANSSNASLKVKPAQQNSSLNSGGLAGKGASPGRPLSSGYQDPRYGFDGVWPTVQFFDGYVFPDGQRKPATKNSGPMSSGAGNISSRNQILQPLPHLMGMHAPRPAVPGMVSKMYPNSRMYNAFGGSQGFHSGIYDSRMNGRWGMPVDNKYKPRGRSNGLYGYGNENSDGLTELNKGPRADRVRNQKEVGPNVTIAVRGQSLPANGNVQDSVGVPERDQYNRADFPNTYSDAKFFIIKSYSEDDVHKSIKYNVWASTLHGNKKLDAAYHEAKQKTSGCPVFLFFSVNTSGQFVGVAEMIGPVDFSKTLDYWQQEKWIGCFPLKWHIVKDVPNSILKHITLENNENKPVTNSRDTQEVKLEQGLQLLKLFKEHVSMTSILDDFGFYETRQKLMQEKRTKQQQFQKKEVEVKPAGSDENDKDAANGKLGLQKPLESVMVLKNESAQVGLAHAEQVPSEKK